MQDVQQIVVALRAMGLSQSEIARRTSIPQPRLSRWEGGAVPVGADDALRLLHLHEQLAAAAPAVPTEEVRDAA